MEDVQKTLQNQLSTIIRDLYAIHVAKINIELTDDFSHGDLTSNIALLIAKEVQKPPREVAEEITKEIRDQNSKFRAEVAGPGFINFWVSKEILSKNLYMLLESSENVIPKTQKDKLVVVEFTDPNPFKEFHIGHLYSNTIGESISRLIESSGAHVKRVNYQGDVGLHVAKALYGIHRKIKNQELTIADFEEMDAEPLQKRAKFLGESYSLGASAYEENETAKQEIQAINKKVYSHDSTVQLIYELGKKWSLEYFEQMYQLLGTHFEHFYFESQAAPKGEKIVGEHLTDGIFEKDNGAIVFKGEKYGLHTRVFINSLGLPTYEAKELGLAKTKYEDFHYDQSIIITGNEINEYFKVLLQVLSLIYPELAAKTIHVSHGMVRLPSGKMSSRTGGVITAEWLLSEVEKRIEQLMKGEKLNSTEKLLVISQIVVGAIKYSLLKSNIGQDIKFDLDSSVSLDGDSGPYLQYTFARSQSVLAKSEVTEVFTHSENILLNLSNIKDEEDQLLRQIFQYHFIVQSSTDNFAPNTLCKYLYELAKLYNLFYQKHPILKSEESVQQLRLALTKATGNVLKHGLYLLGIQAPERM